METKQLHRHSQKLLALQQQARERDKHKHTDRLKVSPTLITGPELFSFNAFIFFYLFNVRKYFLSVCIAVKPVKVILKDS